MKMFLRRDYKKLLELYIFLEGVYMLDFTYRGYKDLIYYLFSKDFNCRLYSDDLQDSCVVLRHDVDFCLDDALKIAKIENKIGVKSTFFCF